jgi:hypothetical protein
MMDQLQVIDAMSSNDIFNPDNEDELDLSLNGSVCSELEFDDGDIDKLFQEEPKLSSLNFEDHELQDLMEEEHASATVTVDTDTDADTDTMPRPLGARNDSRATDGFDSLQNMPFNEVLEEDEMLGGFLLQETNSNNQDSLQRMLDEAFEDESGLGQQHPHLNISLQPPMMDTAQLEAEKQHLLNQLQQLKQQSQVNNNQRSVEIAQNNPFFHQNMQQQQSPLPDPQKTSFAAPLKSSFVASVASVKTTGSTGETPLQSFLRSARKSMNETQPVPQPQHSSLLSKNVPGAPSAASIFSTMPVELEAINSLSEHFPSNSFIGGRSNSRRHLYNSMDKTSATSGNDLVQSVSGANLLNRQGSGRNLAAGSGANASWGVGGLTPSGGAYKSSGMLQKQASESHLFRKNLLSSTKKNSPSRENSAYGLLKKQGSRSNLGSSEQASESHLLRKNLLSSTKKNSLSRENSAYGLLKKQGSRSNLGSSGNLMRNDSFSSNRMAPSRRSTPNTKHKFGNSQSVPHLMHASSNIHRQSPSAGYQGNAQW